MLNWDSNSKNPEGEIIQVLGLPGEHETEIHSILAEYGLPYEFPPEVEADAEKSTKNYCGRSENAEICVKFHFYHRSKRCERF